MNFDIIISGFGGQGALFAGQLLAYAAMDAGYHVTWIPSYGPEMRGGTAHCTVIIADTPIGAPVVRNPSHVIALNNPSLEKYEPLLTPGGLLVYNASLATHSATRADIRSVPIAASDIAAELGAPKLLNMVLLGALLAHSPVLPPAAIEQAMQRHFTERQRPLIEVNRAALRRGRALAQAGAPALHEALG